MHFVGTTNKDYIAINTLTFEFPDGRQFVLESDFEKQSCFSTDREQ